MTAIGKVFLFIFCLRVSRSVHGAPFFVLQENYSTSHDKLQGKKIFFVMLYVLFQIERRETSPRPTVDGGALFTR
ncbi:MAG: hypothetical protein ACI3X1_06850, partial [Eubacteriales bacterium]